MVIAARNAATKNTEQLDNTLALSRAGVELDVMVPSDSSDDATDDIVRSYVSRGVCLVRSP